MEDFNCLCLNAAQDDDNRGDADYNGDEEYNYEDYEQDYSDPNKMEITGLDGNISSPGYPSEDNPEGKYPSNSHYIWYKAGNETTMVQVYWSSNYDY